MIQSAFGIDRRRQAGVIQQLHDAIGQYRVARRRIVQLVQRGGKAAEIVDGFG